MNSRLLSCVAMLMLMFSLSVPAAPQCTRCGPGLIVSPQSLTFAPQVVGTKSATITVMLRSVGILPVTFDSIASSAPPFPETNDCPHSLPGNAICRIRVTFAPTAIGTFNGAITIRDNAGTQIVTLTGRGVAAGAYSPPPKFVYSVDFSEGKVRGYLVSASTGAIEPTGQNPPWAHWGPTRVVSDKGGYRLYVINHGSKDVNAYFINRHNGYIAAVPGSPFGPIDAGPNGYGPTDIKVHPSGHYVYVTTPTGVYGFAVGSNGSLKIVSGSPFSTSFGSLALAINPSGKFLYVSTSSLIGNTTYSAVDAFSINPVDGTLTPIAGTPFIGPASIKCDAAADDMDFDPTGQYLILPDHCAGVTIFRLNSSVGTLAQVPGSPFALPSPNMEANSVAIDPLGRFVYIEVGCLPNCSSSALTYKLNSQSGAVSYAQAKTTQNESWLRADPSGKFVYDFGVNGNPATQIRGWSVNQSTGAFANVPGSPFPYKSTWLAITP